MTNLSLSLVIPIFQDQDNLDRLCNELIQNQSDQNWEVIVVDDGSSPALKWNHPVPENWQIISNPTRQGAAVSRNRGAQTASGSHLVFLSGFLSLPNDYVARVYEFITTHNFDYAQHLLEKEPGIQLSHFQEFVVDQKRRTQPNEGPIPVKQSLFTAAIIERDLFLAQEGFDETMRHYGGHEMDFIYRLHKAGYPRRVYVKDLPLRRVRLESHETIRQRLQEYGRVGLPALLKKHPELKNSILVAPMLWSLFSLVGFTRLLESWMSSRIDSGKHLPGAMYRLYLHLITRNAWDAR